MAMNLFLELSIVILVAMAISIAMRFLKQPLIIGYILTGIVAGPLFLNVSTYSDILSSLSQIGIAFLLFTMGLSLDLKNFKELGVVSIFAGLGQILVTGMIGYLIGISFGFSSITSLYFGVAFSFSSTIIAVKLLTDRREIDTLHGRIAVGVLLVQDIVVLFVLMFLSTYSQTIGFSWNILAIAILKTVILVVLLPLISNFVMPKIVSFMAKSQEMLFLFSIGWVLLMSLIFDYFGFGIEIGALFAGISLASSPYHYEISGKIKPLRDFFIILFFVLLGSKIDIGFSNVIVPVIFSLFIIFVKPIILAVLLGLKGYHKKIGLYAGFPIAQISEFSLILVLMGQRLGHIEGHALSIVTIVGLLTITGSAYMVRYSKSIYPILAKFLPFEIKNDEMQKAKPHKIILFGYNRIGYSLINPFAKLKKKFIVVDYNPEVIALLKKQGIEHKYGDASDIDLLNELSLDKVDMAISTIPDLDTNLLIVNKIRFVNPKAVIIITSHNIDEAFKCYDAGANYVLLPHFLGGEHASTLIEKFGTNTNKFIKEKIKHIKELESRKNLGHEHPSLS